MKQTVLRFATIKEGKMRDYIRHHKNLPSAMSRNLAAKGITGLDIYRNGNNLVMVLTTDPDKAKPELIDRAANAEWGRLMKGIIGKSWTKMNPIFSLRNPRVRKKVT